jgi:CheY-like chemotaxis protein
VFDPFFTTKGVGRGTGLGLATVHGIAFQSGGAVDVLTTPGEGTEFRVYLPQSSQAPATVSEPARPSLTNVPVARSTILLAEDDPELRSVLRRILVRMGHEVITAESGQAALAVADGRAEVPLLVTDVLMPGLGGPEVFERLRARWPKLRVLFVSGHAAGERVPNADGNQVAFLAKPFSPDALRRKVTAMLAPAAPKPR